MTDRRILIEASELERKLGDSGWVAIDCRFDLADSAAGRARYENAHIPGAVYFDLDQDLAGPVCSKTGRHPLPDVRQFEQALGLSGIGNQHHVVVYDDANGGVAARAWWLLHWLGHDKVRLLDGGFARWQALGFPTEQGIATRAPATFRGHPRPDLVITTDELAGNVEQIADMNLLDARDGARYRGETEPIDPIAGHIPGARNLPFGHFVRRDGTWLSRSERERLLLDALGGDREAAWCVMCGSGVTACHLVISALEAGLREPRVYIGSWSEWIREEGRPII